MQADSEQRRRLPGRAEPRAARRRTEPRLRLRQLPPPRGRREGHRNAQRPAPAEQDHQGVLRPPEQRGHQGRQPIRLRPAQDDDADGAGETVQSVRPHHHVAHPLRELRRAALHRRGAGPVERSRVHPLRPESGSGTCYSGVERNRTQGGHGANNGEVREQSEQQREGAGSARGLLAGRAALPRSAGAIQFRQVPSRHQQGPAALQPAGRRAAGRRAAGRRGLGVVHLRVQPGAGDGGERAVAAVRAVRRRAEREGDPRPADQQVQGLRVHHHDQLRRGRGRDPVAQRLHAREQSAAGQFQDQQDQDDLSRRGLGLAGR